VSVSPIRVRTPARVNIIGEHTDYNDGFVLPVNTALFTSVSARLRDDRKVRVTSNSLGETQVFDLDALQPADTVTWVDYVKGVAAELQLAGIHLCGADLEIDSDIPLGAGLSSSASLELSVARALLVVANADAEVTAVELAKLCQRAEHNFAGVHCGIMDQYTLACAQRGHALLLDCRSLAAEQVALPGHAGFILSDSGVRHRLAAGAYNNRADECAAAVATLAAMAPGIRQLRDVNLTLLESAREKLGERLYRRCRHVLNENERVQRMVLALKNDDVAGIGVLLDACHVSLRDDFAVSCDELDALVAAANASDRVCGSRMIGAGFGGCVLSVCHADDIDAATQDIGDNYAALTGRRPWQHQVAAAAPARVIQ
jgi:galactokinase